ncbi:hypothetical protein MNEG_6952 [Monoraphidium neglectum]|uniref:Hexosyltransferase n=1 Tax=Monoraphidium neglectum TaxID=145388 RepID=A0A0D2N4P1_9CHLO|nr:hypothetical protein MNEG_6952 [Monoraphidium neglectum]KIZ01011.1 hypothetical protein MNEG_6952 [Monoraphidium neglectum]|eukprot:XP_013900030.1 hypothetical protein MNEG_6952 [Monoraphidium neglectum]
MRPRRAAAVAAIAIFIATSSASAASLSPPAAPSPPGPAPLPGLDARLVALAGRRKTLVLYSVASLSDTTALENLRHFVSTAVPAAAPGPVHYVFLMPPAISAAAAAGASADADTAVDAGAEGGDSPARTAAAETAARTLPPLPSGANARYVAGAPACAHGWGAFGWYLQEGDPGAAAAYDALVFLSSSMAGPFLPRYVQGRLHWLTPFLRKLDGHARIVSPTISCARTRAPGAGRGAPAAATAAGAGGSSRRVPHPELGAVALDAEALRFLLALNDEEGAPGARGASPTGAAQQRELREGGRRDGGGSGGGGGVFGCYASAAVAEHHVAAAAAEAVLQRGWSIDSLMLRYQGINWVREPQHWHCNAGLSPQQGDWLYDGVPLDPLEVMFVPRQAHLVARDAAAAAHAGRLQAWAQASAGSPETALASAAANGHRVAAARARRLARLEADAMSGAACFDADYYAAVHPDLGMLAGDAAALYRHYELHGMAEGRRHRWRCEPLREALVVAPLQRVVRALADADADVAGA